MSMASPQHRQQSQSLTVRPNLSFEPTRAARLERQAA